MVKLGDGLCEVSCNNAVNRIIASRRRIACGLRFEKNLSYRK